MPTMSTTAEGSTIAFERSQLNTLFQHIERHLDDIEDARVRLLDGRHGLCETCHQPISAVRIDARPLACDSVVCAAVAREHPELSHRWVARTRMAGRTK